MGFRLEVELPSDLGRQSLAVVVVWRPWWCDKREPSVAVGEEVDACHLVDLPPRGCCFVPFGLRRDLVNDYLAWSCVDGLAHRSERMLLALDVDLHERRELSRTSNKVGRGGEGRTDRRGKATDPWT